MENQKPIQRALRILKRSEQVCDEVTKEVGKKEEIKKWGRKKNAKMQPDQGSNENECVPECSVLSLRFWWE